MPTILTRTKVVTFKDQMDYKGGNLLVETTRDVEDDLISTAARDYPGATTSGVVMDVTHDFTGQAHTITATLVVSPEEVEH